MPARTVRKSPARSSRAGGAPVRAAVADSPTPPIPPASAGATEPPTRGAATQVNEPVWLVRAVLVLFLIGFAAFLARELRNFLSSLP